MREFWIDDFLSDKADFVTCVSRAPKTHFIHVIEKSAYDALESRCEKLEEALDHVKRSCAHTKGLQARTLIKIVRQALAQDEGEQHE